MLKKSDLSKQFELVVQQEIKNYQDSLNFVLQSIRELRDSIEHLRGESLENYASLHSEHNSLMIELQKNKDNYSSLYQRLESSLSDQRIVNEKTILEMQDITGCIFSRISEQNKLQEKIKIIWVDVSNLRKESENNFRIFNDNLDDLLRRFRQEILKMKNEILETPSEASIVRTQLEEKIVSHTVDVAGIMRELNVYKKENHVTQKKIENIYKLIERLSKSEVLP